MSQGQGILARRGAAVSQGAGAKGAGTAGRTAGAGDAHLTRKPHSGVWVYSKFGIMLWTNFEEEGTSTPAQQ